MTLSLFTGKPLLQHEDRVDAAENFIDQTLDYADPQLLLTESGAAGSMRVGLFDAQAVCYTLAAHSGWWLDTETGEDVRTWPKKFMDLWISAKLMLIVTEVAEAMEGHRKGLMDDHLPHRSTLEVELADNIIRALDLGGGLGLDVAGAVIEKLAYNQQRADHQLANRQAAGGKSI